MKTTQQAVKNALKGCHRPAVANAMQMAIGSLNNQVAGELPYQPKGKTPNFLDRVMSFMEAVESQTGKLTLLEYMAEEFGCILVKNPAIRAGQEPIIKQVAEILRDFAAVIDEISKAESDLSISKDEGAKIRARWEVMKRLTEEFVLACESGVYDQKK